MKKLLFTLLLVGNLLALSAEEHTYIMSDYAKPAFTTNDFPFYLVFVGNNQAKLRYEYTHNGQTANPETQPFDLDDF